MHGHLCSEGSPVRAAQRSRLDVPEVLHENMTEETHEREVELRPVAGRGNLNLTQSSACGQRSRLCVHVWLHFNHALIIGTYSHLSNLKL
jgi:hypothetical protein